MKKLLIILSMLLFVSLALAMPPTTMKMLEVVAAKNDVVPGGEDAISVIDTVEANNSTQSGTITITHGMTISANDVIVAMINANSQGGTNSVSDNNGATSFSRGYSVYVTNADCEVFIRAAGASEPDTYSWTVSTTGASWSIILLQIRYADTVTPWDVQPASALVVENASNGSYSAPTITVTAGALGILWAVADSSSSVWSDPSNGYANLTYSAANRTNYVWYKTWASAGATGATSATFAGSSPYIGIVQFAVDDTAN